MHIDKNMCGTFSLSASYPRVMIGPSVIFMFYYTDEIVLHVPEDDTLKLDSSNLISTVIESKFVVAVAKYKNFAVLIKT